MVHYRESNDKEEKFERPTVHPIVVYFVNLHLSSISNVTPLPELPTAAAMDTPVPQSVSYDDEMDVSIALILIFAIYLLYIHLLYTCVSEHVIICFNTLCIWLLRLVAGKLP
ncbi:hypothetical protein EON65_27090 [archaeon]|nr:MAG: hypothetical protein EON65_27090 [archaeon]